MKIERILVDTTRLHLLRRPTGIWRESRNISSKDTVSRPYGEPGMLQGIVNQDFPRRASPSRFTSSPGSPYSSGKAMSDRSIFRSAAIASTTRLWSWRCGSPETVIAPIQLPLTSRMGKLPP